MRLIGLLCLGLGVLLLAAAVVIGMPFVGVYLMGFIGTGGREAGRELVPALVATLGTGGVGWVLLRFGRALRR